MNEIVLDAGQLYLIGLVATLAAQGIKIVAKKMGKNVTKLGITLVAFVISLVFAAVWFMPAFAVSEDPMAFALALVQAATAILGAAVTIYNVVLEKVLQKLGGAFNVLLEP